jgi:hypothetical protein
MTSIQLPKIFFKSNASSLMSYQFIQGYFINQSIDKQIYARLLSVDIPYTFQTVNLSYLKNEKMYVSVNGVWNTLTIPDGGYYEAGGVNAYLYEWISNPSVRYDTSGPDYRFRFSATSGAMRFPFYFDTNLALSIPVLIVQNITPACFDILGNPLPQTDFIIAFDYPIGGPFAPNDPAGATGLHNFGPWMGFNQPWPIQNVGTDANVNGVGPVPYGGGSVFKATSTYMLGDYVRLGFYIETDQDLRVDSLSPSGSLHISYLAQVAPRIEDRAGGMIKYKAINDAFDSVLSNTNTLRNFNLKIVSVYLPTVEVRFNNGIVSAVVSLVMKDL